MKAINDSFSLFFGEMASPFLNSFEELLDAYSCCPGLDQLVQFFPAFLDGSSYLPLILFYEP
ncbi:MAG: hypothetical protein WA700_18150 [Acidobacteriaceae bacterium]